MIIHKKNKKNTTKNSDVIASEHYMASSSLEENLTYVEKMMGNSSDLRIRKFLLDPYKNIKAAVLYIQESTDKKLIGEIMHKLVLLTMEMPDDLRSKDTKLYDIILNSLLSITEVMEYKSVKETALVLCQGNTLFLMDGYDSYIIIKNERWEKRSIDEPAVENITNGPREGFVEALSTNVTMLRKRIKNPKLRVEKFPLGQTANTETCIIYVDDIVNQNILKEVKERIKKIEIDAVLESQYIIELLADPPFSPFPKIISSQRPDTIASKLLEGRIALIVEGSPEVITVPTILPEFFNTPDDYYSSPFFVLFTRFLRYASFFVSLLLPGIYTATVAFHPEFIPTELLTGIYAAQEATPFPIAVELLIMLGAFEILKEAGLRMPNPFGQTITIFGAIILGEAAIMANLAGAATVIIVGITVVALFVVPSRELTNSLVLLRYGFLLAGSVMGIIGVTALFALMLIHMCSLKSFSIPYLHPLAPLNRSDSKDVLFRMPRWALLSRPHLMVGKNKVRQNREILKHQLNNKDRNEEQNDDKES